MNSVERIDVAVIDFLGLDDDEKGQLTAWCQDVEKFNHVYNVRGVYAVNIVGAWEHGLAGEYIHNLFAEAINRIPADGELDLLVVLPHHPAMAAFVAVDCLAYMDDFSGQVYFVYRDGTLAIESL